MPSDLPHERHARFRSEPAVTGAALFTVWLLTLLKVAGGAVLLWLLGAPAWAVAAWLMLHVRVRLDLSRLKGRR